MKKIIYMILFALVAISAYAQMSEVSATILRYEPSPAEQGTVFDVWVQLSNAGTTAKKVEIKFVPEYPFSLPVGQSAIRKIGTIGATEEVVEKFSIFIDPNAPNGDRTITFWYKYDSDNWIELDALITLQTQDAVLVVENYEVTPEQVVPGQNFDIKMTLQNQGKIDVKNVDISLELEEKFSTVGSGTKKRIPIVYAGETAEVGFTLSSATSTSIDLYSIPVSLEFSDTRNQNYNDSVKVSVAVNAEPEIAMTVDSTDFKDKEKPGTVSLKVINKGIVNVKYVNVKLVPTEQYEILSSSNEDYVGNLDNDDFETVDFLIKTKVPSPRLNVELEFKDPYNKNFAQQHQLPLRIITDEDLGKKKSPVKAIVIGVLVIIGLIIWRRRKSKKKRR